MKALIQRVTSSSVSVGGETIGEIGKGITVLLGVVPDDTQKDIDWLAEKIVNLRVFDDEAGKMNLSLKDVGGEALIVSQFTLCGDCRKGRRPSWAKAAPPEFANEMYEKFISAVEKEGVRTAHGKFQAYMAVDIHNDGPVTLMIDTKE
ncbi:D-aminoacyl-tRNA deacylase [Cloacibacillus sp. An23]|uniref:D-aminoacyl-tRNA deacylase n=1 Tax=Cloacibacillus sp. An23 TaxID=1965591 RepID=UPI000B37F996|nr:D-aminoacyl-tRNA deacylase [Cloacibacillus sp. An23]OUO91883.1 D-tyrosyl-tRNA(Tyr) deacylase [Cloacibacillus sp. An23]